MSFILGSVDNSALAIRRRASKASYKGPVIVRTNPGKLLDPTGILCPNNEQVPRPSENEINRAVTATECCINGHPITVKLRVSKINLWNEHDCRRVLTKFYLFPFADLLITDEVQQYVNKVLVKIIQQMLILIDDYKQSFTFDRMNVRGLVSAFAVCMTVGVYQPLHAYAAAINIEDLKYVVDELSHVNDIKQYKHFINCIVTYMEQWDDPLLPQIIEDAGKLFELAVQ